MTVPLLSTPCMVGAVYSFSGPVISSLFRARNQALPNPHTPSLLLLLISDLLQVRSADAIAAPTILLTVLLAVFPISSLSLARIFYSVFCISRFRRCVIPAQLKKNNLFQTFFKSPPYRTPYQSVSARALGKLHSRIPGRDSVSSRIRMRFVFEFSLFPSICLCSWLDLLFVAPPSDRQKGWLFFFSLPGSGSPVSPEIFRCSPLWGCDHM